MIWRNALLRAALALTAASIVLSLSGCLTPRSSQLEAPGERSHGLVTAETDARAAPPVQLLSFAAGQQLNPAIALGLVASFRPEWTQKSAADGVRVLTTDAGCAVAIAEQGSTASLANGALGDELASQVLLDATLPGLSTSVALSERHSIAELAWSEGAAAQFLRYDAGFVDGSRLIVLARVFESTAQAKLVVVQCPVGAPAQQATMTAAIAGLTLTDDDTLVFVG